MPGHSNAVSRHEADAHAATLDGVAMNPQTAPVVDGLSRLTIDIDFPFEELKKISDRIVHKYDKLLLPIIFVAYLVFWLDRSNIALARHNGLEEDLKLSGSQFNQALAVFFAMYIVCNIPANLVLRKIGGRRVLSFLIFFWGLFTILSGFATNFSTLCAVRAAVGAAEAGFLGSALLWLGFFYTNEEIVARIGILLSSAPLAGALGGLLAGGFARISVTKFRGWPWIFFIEGAITMVVGCVAFYMIPDTPMEARFLTTTEKLASQHRMVVLDAQSFSRRLGESMRNGCDVDGDKSVGSESPPIPSQEVNIRNESYHFFNSNALDRLRKTSWRRAILHPITLILTVGCFLTIESIYSYNLFVPTLLHSMGYTGVSIALMSVPPSVTAFIYTIVVTQYSQRRGSVAGSLALSGLVSATGYILLLIGSAAGGTDENGAPVLVRSVQYVGTFFASSGVSAATPLALSWTCVNAHPHFVRAIALGFMISLGNFATFLASFVYVKNKAPRYVLSLALEASNTH
jgi:hypothetical protein